MIATTMEDHIVVCGLGNVGIRVVQHLRRMNEEVVCIESDGEGRFLQEVEGAQVPVLIGDCRVVKTLEGANIDKAKAVICVTNNDLTNLEAALTARELNPKIRVVMRMFDQSGREIDVFPRYHIPFAELWSNSVKLRAGNGLACVASFDHLLHAKRTTARPHDLVDVECLLAIKR